MLHAPLSVNTIAVLHVIVREGVEILLGLLPIVLFVLGVLACEQEHGQKACLDLHDLLKVQRVPVGRNHDALVITLRQRLQLLLHGGVARLPQFERLLLVPDVITVQVLGELAFQLAVRGTHTLPIYPDFVK